MTSTTTDTVRRELTYVQRQALAADLRSDRVTTRKQGKKTLSYLEAWDVKASLIKVFGFAGFSADASEGKIIHLENNVPKVEWRNNERIALPITYDEDGQITFGSANFRVTCSVKVQLTIHQTGASYTEYATASQTGPDIGEVADFAIKTAESDALKRAATYLGTQFGLSLYASDDQHVHYADVVQKVLAPGQEWPATAEEILEWEEWMKHQNDLWIARHPEQQASSNPRVSTPAEGVTPEQHEENLALVDKAIRSRREKDEAATAAK